MSDLPLNNSDMVTSQTDSVNIPKSVKDVPNLLYLKLKERILLKECNINLPNEKWGLHKCLKSKSLIFSYFEVVPSPDNENQKIPMCFKRVCFFLLF